TLVQRQAAVRAATLRIRPAGTLPDPMLTVGVMDLLLPHFEFNRSDFTEVDVELSQEIPWPGSLGARSGVVRAAAAGARAEEGTVRRELTTAMAVAYYRLGYTVTALETLRHQRQLPGGGAAGALGVPPVAPGRWHPPPTAGGPLAGRRPARRRARFKSSVSAPGPTSPCRCATVTVRGPSTSTRQTSSPPS